MSAERKLRKQGQTRLASDVI